MINVTPMAIGEVLLIEPPRFADERGFFSETFNAAAFAEVTGFDRPFVQDNQSLSRRKGTVRGLHFQTPPAAQDKLVRVLRGAIFAVAVDIRTGSPTFGRHVATELSASNWRQLFLPRGFAFGMCTLVDDTEVAYKVSAHYAVGADSGIAWNDPAIGIDWPVTEAEAILSEKDRHLPMLRAIGEVFVYAA